MTIGTTVIEGNIGVISIDSPPVNALSAAVRQTIHDGLTTLQAAADVAAIVIICGGRTFFAGADLSEFGKPEVAPRLIDVFDAIENSPKPVVSAIHGTALGGGLELALVCAYRIASPDAKVGLPEVKLGLMPGAGGTQRLPRLIGVEAALDLMTSGRAIGSTEAQALGILDAVIDGDLREGAIAFAKAQVADHAAHVPLRDRDTMLGDARDRPEIFDAFLAKNARAFNGFPAPTAIVAAVRAAVDLPFDAGKAREWELFLELEAGRASAALRHLFTAERKAVKIPGIGRDTPVAPVASVGVIGAGTMGTGIAMNFLAIGLPVVLVERTTEALDRGVATIRRTLESSAAKGRLRGDGVEQQMALVTASTDIAALHNADLVIEAVFESMAIKQDVFRQLDRIAKPGALLATNTSFLDIDEIAAVTGRPGDVLGLHFFSPAHIMRLLEIVRTKATSNSALATGLQLAKRIGKTAVVSGVCDGFIANRAMKARAMQADALILEGTAVEAVDAALTSYGFAIGHFQTMDLVGLDVIGRDDATLSVMGELVARGRLGLKSGGGFYDYDDKRRPTLSPVAAEVIGHVAERGAMAQRPTEGNDAILARLLYPVVNEGARILEEGIALRASDIDVAIVTGYNWPIYTGGPMFWADHVGLRHIVSTLDALASEHGETFAPAALLRKMAANGGSFAGHDNTWASTQ